LTALFTNTPLSRLFPTIGSQIITEAGSTEDLPESEIGEFYLSRTVLQFEEIATFILGCVESSAASIVCEANGDFIVLPTSKYLEF
jgi:hypothetical protein